MSGIGDLNSRFAKLVDLAGISRESVAALRSAAPIIPAEIASPKIAKALVDMGYQAAGYAFSFGTAVGKKSPNTQDSSNTENNSNNDFNADKPSAHKTKEIKVAAVVKEVVEKETKDPEHKTEEAPLFADMTEPHIKAKTDATINKPNFGVDIA